MQLQKVWGNTWVLKSWNIIPLYKLDNTHCILLDSGLMSQQQEIDSLLRQKKLTCVGIIGSHAHLDHAGNHRYYKQRYGATLAMPLGEAGLLASDLGTGMGIYNLSPGQIQREEQLDGISCLSDMIILPTEDRVTMHGVTFEVIHTPGHSIDHIAVKTPDEVLYLGDALMTGETLLHAKFPYAFSLADCFGSLRRLEKVPARSYIAAHFGVYPEISSHVRLELDQLHKRMLEILELVKGNCSLEQVTQKICESFSIRPKMVSDMAYFERATRSYLHYLLDLGLLEEVLIEGLLRYRRTGALPQPL